MVITSLAGTISIGKFGAACLASSARTTFGCPTSITRTPNSRAASTLPSTSGRGALSPPMASTAIVIMDDLPAGYRALRLGRRRFLFHGFAFVIATVWAGLMGLLHFVAIGAFAERGLAEKIVGAARAGSTFRVPSFWVRHGSTPHSRSVRAAFFCGRERPDLLFLQPVLLQSRERSHSRVCCVGLTAALFVIQIGAAIGA